MVDENEVKRWIARLETEESSWTNYERLAVLYAIRDQQSGSREKALPMAYSAAPAPVSVETYGDSDFFARSGRCFTGQGVGDHGRADGQLENRKRARL